MITKVIREDGGSPLAAIVAIVKLVSSKEARILEVGGVGVFTVGYAAS